MQGPRKLVYGMAKSMKASKELETHVVLNKEGEPLLDETEEAEGWREYFEELLNVQEEEEKVEIVEAPLRERQGLEETRLIQLEEVREAIKMLRKGKSAGYDGLSNELFKTGKGITKWFTLILNKIWEERK